MGISPRYVLDEMEMYEVSAIIENAYCKNRTSWDQTRFLSYIMAKLGSSAKLNRPEDLMSFPWDEKEEEKEPMVITDNDVDRLKEKMQQFIKEKTSCQQI